MPYFLALSGVRFFVTLEPFFDMDLAMLDKEPFVYPSRHRFVYDPGISDRQLWAIGMIVVQWSMTEYWIDMSTHQLMNKDEKLLTRYKAVRGFQLSLMFWEFLLDTRSTDPFKSSMKALVPRIKDLSAQRDEIVHRMWGGGMEAQSPAAAGLPTTDAGMLPNPGERFKASEKGGLIPFKWKADFSRLRRLATDIGELNRNLLAGSFAAGPPHGFVDTGTPVPNAGNLA